MVDRISDSVSRVTSDQKAQGAQDDAKARGLKKAQQAFAVNQSLDGVQQAVKSSDKIVVTTETLTADRALEPQTGGDAVIAFTPLVGLLADNPPDNVEPDEAFKLPRTVTLNAQSQLQLSPAAMKSLGSIAIMSGNEKNKLIQALVSTHAKAVEKLAGASTAVKAQQDLNMKKLIAALEPTVGPGIRAAFAGKLQAAPVAGSKGKTAPSDPTSTAPTTPGVGNAPADEAGLGDAESAQQEAGAADTPDAPAVNPQGIQWGAPAKQADPAGFVSGVKSIEAGGADPYHVLAGGDPLGDMIAQGMSIDQIVESVLYGVATDNENELRDAAAQMDKANKQKAAQRKVVDAMSAASSQLEGEMQVEFSKMQHDGTIGQGHTLEEYESWRMVAVGKPQTDPAGNLMLDANGDPLMMPPTLADLGTPPDLPSWLSADVPTPDASGADPAAPGGATNAIAGKYGLTDAQESMLRDYFNKHEGAKGGNYDDTDAGFEQWLSSDKLGLTPLSGSGDFTDLQANNKAISAWISTLPPAKGSDSGKNLTTLKADITAAQDIANKITNAKNAHPPVDPSKYKAQYAAAMKKLTGDEGSLYLDKGDEKKFNDAIAGANHGKGLDLYTAAGLLDGVTTKALSKALGDQETAFNAIPQQSFLADVRPDLVDASQAELGKLQGKLAAIAALAAKLNKMKPGDPGADALEVQMAAAVASLATEMGKCKAKPPYTDGVLSNEDTATFTAAYKKVMGGVGDTDWGFEQQALKNMDDPRAKAPKSPPNDPRTEMQETQDQANANLDAASPYMFGLSGPEIKAAKSLWYSLSDADKQSLGPTEMEFLQNSLGLTMQSDSGYDPAANSAALSSYVQTKLAADPTNEALLADSANLTSAAEPQLDCAKYGVPDGDAALVQDAWLDMSEAGRQKFGGDYQAFLTSFSLTPGDATNAQKLEDGINKLNQSGDLSDSHTQNITSLMEIHANWGDNITDSAKYGLTPQEGQVVQDLWKSLPAATRALYNGDPKQFLEKALGLSATASATDNAHLLGEYLKTGVSGAGMSTGAIQATAMVGATKSSGINTQKPYGPPKPGQSQPAAGLHLAKVVATSSPGSAILNAIKPPKPDSALYDKWKDAKAGTLTEGSSNTQYVGYLEQIGVIEKPATTVTTAPPPDDPGAQGMPENADASASLMTLKSLGSQIQAQTDKLDSMNDMSQELETRLQIINDRRSQAYEIISNILKKISDTSDGIIADLKN